MINNNRQKRTCLLVAFDVIFIMLLCFATLLSTMLIRGKVIVGSGAADGFEYNFDSTSFIIAVSLLGFYLVYLIKKSDKELRQMISNAYDHQSIAPTEGRSEK